MRAIIQIEKAEWEEFIDCLIEEEGEVEFLLGTDLFLSLYIEEHMTLRRMGLSWSEIWFMEEN